MAEHTRSSMMPRSGHNPSGADEAGTGGARKQSHSRHRGSSSGPESLGFGLGVSPCSLLWLMSHSLSTKTLLCRRISPAARRAPLWLRPALETARTRRSRRASGATESALCRFCTELAQPWLTPLFPGSPSQGRERGSRRAARPSERRGRGCRRHRGVCHGGGSGEGKMRDPITAARCGLVYSDDRPSCVRRFVVIVLLSSLLRSSLSS